MSSALDQLARLLGQQYGALYPWHELHAGEVRRLRRQLVQAIEKGELAPSTVNKRLAALRGVLRATRESGHMPTVKAAEAIRAATNVPHPTSTSESSDGRRIVTPNEIRAYMESCIADMQRTDVRPYSYRRGRREDRLRGHHLRGARDAALAALGYGCGLKPSEVRALTLDDVSSEARRLTVGNERRRTLFLIGGVRRALLAWLERRPEDQEHLFFGLSKYGEPVRRPLSQQGLYDLLRWRACGPPFSFQDLRRTFRARLKEAGVREAVRRALLGLRPRSAPPSEDELRAALELVDVPFCEAL